MPLELFPALGLQGALTQEEADDLYSPLGHDHDDLYYTQAESDALYLTPGEADATYSPLGHDHDADYSPLAHDHDADYEPLGAVATHSADTTAVHGITDTADLATLSGAQTFAGAKRFDAGITFAADGGGFYRAGAAQLETDSSLKASRPASGNGAFLAQVAGDTLARLQIRADGQITWGPGTGSRDIEMVRLAADRLWLKDGFDVSSASLTGGALLSQAEVYIDPLGFVDAVRAGSTDGSFRTAVAGDTVPRLRINAAGLHDWGAGGASAADISLSRSAVGTLTVTGNASVGVLQMLSGGATAAGQIQVGRVTLDGNLLAAGAANQGVTGTAQGDVVLKQAASGSKLWLGVGTVPLISMGNNTLGFFGTAATAKAAVTGSRGGNAALASLLTELAAKGLLTDSSTA